MPWKFICDLRFHEVLQTTIIRQITKENEEIEKIVKIEIDCIFRFFFRFIHFLTLTAWRVFFL